MAMLSRIRRAQQRLGRDAAAASSERRWVRRWALEAWPVVVSWVALAVTGNWSEIYLPIAFSAGAVSRGMSLWLWSKGAPEWTPNEAYITSLRRWRRSRRV
jgi:hypothetical protein